MNTYMHATPRSYSPCVFLCVSSDWAGGQLTASAVSAVDFGPYNTHSANLPASFVSLLATLPGNPGQYYTLHTHAPWCR